DLRDLALTKYKEALLFLPDDADLQAKAEIPADERKRGRRDDRRAGSAPGDDVSDEAARVFLAATRGRVSEARLAARQLATSDAGGSRRAELADALRARAAAAWAAGRRDDARPLYGLVRDLDPGD